MTLKESTAILFLAGALQGCVFFRPPPVTSSSADGTTPRTDTVQPSDRPDAAPLGAPGPTGTSDPVVIPKSH